MHDLIDHAVIQQELRRLKPFGQVLPERLFNHTGSREADHGPWFCQDRIAEHRETCADAAGGGVREDGDVWDTPFTQLRQHR